MSKQKHQEYLIRSAQRTVAKISKRQQKLSWTEEEVQSVRIQTLEPYKRGILAALAVACLVWALFGHLSGGAVIALLIAAVVLLFMAAYGIRRTVKNMMNNGLEDLPDIICGLLD
jgi:Flp pilus assembly protein TadB